MLRPTARLAVLLGVATLPTIGCAAPPRGAAPAPAPTVAGPEAEPRSAAMQSAPTDGGAPSEPAAPRRDAAADRALADAWRAVVANAPLSPRRMNYFHSSLGIPRMDTATTLPKGAFSLRANTSHARSRKEETKDGVHQDFDGTYREWLGLEGNWAASDGFELAGRANLAGWDEHQDRFKVFDENGVGIVRDENPGLMLGATSRHLNLASFGVRSKIRLCPPVESCWDFALAPSLQIPFGKSRDLTHAGTYDAALTLLGTRPLGKATLHANLGVTWPLGNQSLFTNEADVDLDPLAHAGVGVAVPLGGAWTGIAQIEGNTSAFSDVDVLDDDPVNFVFGVRHVRERTALDIALGTAFDWDAGYQMMVDVGFTIRF